MANPQGPPILTYPRPKMSAPAGPPPSPPPEVLFQELMRENCAVKSVVSGVVGFVFGGLMGAFFASFEQMGPALPGTPGYTAEVLSTKETMRQMLRHTYSRAASQAKGFGLVGAVFAGTECIIEHYRGTNDMGNMLMAGCLTGGVLGLRAGPKPAVAGCAGFAAFSYLMEKLFIHPD